MGIFTVGIGAFIGLACVYYIGEFISTKTKAMVPSVFVMAVLFLAAYWTGFFPKEIYSIAGFGGILSNTKGAVIPDGVSAASNLIGVTILLLITHMGTTISVKEMAQQWKVIVVCAGGLAGMVAADLAIMAVGLVAKEYVISGLPPLTGGIIAAMTMQQAALEKGLQEAAMLAIAMYVMQGFVGYPLTAILLRKEGTNLLKDLRSGKIKHVKQNIEMDEDGKLITDIKTKKKLIPSIPDKYYTVSFGLLKTALVASLAFLSNKYIPGNINGGVYALIYGVIFCELGFLDKDTLKKCGCLNFLMYILMLYVFDGLKTSTPEMITTIVGPLVIIIVFGVAGMVLVTFLLSKLVKMSPYIAISTALTALYGFPPNYMLTEEASKALAANPEEKDFLMDSMLPQMLVGGFVTVTITSVLLAGYFATLL